MAKPPEAAAARHMSSGTARPAPGGSAAGASFPVRPGANAADVRSYRRKRAVAWVLTVLVAAAAPVLVTVLVIFG